MRNSKREVAAEYAKRIAKPGDKNYRQNVIQIDNLEDEMLDDEELKSDYSNRQYGINGNRMEKEERMINNSYQYDNKPYKNNNYSGYKNRVSINKLEELQGNNHEYSSEIEKIKAMFN